LVSALATLKDWQTLATGLIALIVASATIWTMRRHIHLQTEQFDERHRRRLIASRAMLPNDLSTIIEYANECAEVSGRGLLMIRNQIPRETLFLPAIPERLFQNLQNLTEYLNESDAKEMSALLRCFQIQRARMRSSIYSFNNPLRFGRHWITTAHNFERTFDGTVELYLLAENIFGFARGKTESIPKPAHKEESVTRAIRLLEIEDLLSPEYIKLLVKHLSGDWQPTQ
jgi:hypothetical protein